jgi:hypothetical protein
MWIDLNGVADDDHYISAVISVQGVNPVTGQRTSELRLEQYQTKCPVHNVDFQQDRFCPECKYKWPAQNYIASNVTPEGRFWIDGFRSDGKVRQYIFTADEAKGVASNIIGDQRVYAIGIAFYRSKAKKPPKPQPMLMDSFNSFNYGSARGMLRCCSVGAAAAPASYTKGIKGASVSKQLMSYSPMHTNKVVSRQGAVPVTSSEVSFEAETLGAMDAAMAAGEIGDSGAEIKYMSLAESSAAIEEVKVTKSYEVGAGVSIDQQVHSDTEPMNFWEEQPVGMIYVNYADGETVKRILAAGKRQEKKEGFLNAIPVGN